LAAPIIKVAITGPESIGKSTLAAQLAAHYQTAWVPEYARDYLAQLPHRYTPPDIEQIARGQIMALQNALPAAHKILFADTDLLVIKIWFTHAFGYCPGWILEALERQDFDLYLLLDVDPHLRQFFYDWYKKELQYYGFAFAEISGNQEERLQNALVHVSQLRTNIY
jgi:nicotinamide riboside kinase